MDQTLTGNSWANWCPNVGSQLESKTLSRVRWFQTQWSPSGRPFPSALIEEMTRAGGWLWSSLCSLHRRRWEWSWGGSLRLGLRGHPLISPISLSPSGITSDMNIWCAGLSGKDKASLEKVTWQEIICPIKWNTVYSIILPAPLADKREIPHHWHATSWSTGAF